MQVLLVAFPYIALNLLLTRLTISRLFVAQIANVACNLEYSTEFSVSRVFSPEHT